MVSLLLCMAPIGVLISCAIPATSNPSAAIFSEWIDCDVRSSFLLLIVLFRNESVHPLDNSFEDGGGNFVVIREEVVKILSKDLQKMHVLESCRRHHSGLTVE